MNAGNAGIVPIVLPNMLATLSRLVGLELGALGGFDLSDGVFLRRIEFSKNTTDAFSLDAFPTDIGIIKVSFTGLPRGYARLWQEWLDSLGKEVAKAVSDKLCSAAQNDSFFETQPIETGLDSNSVRATIFNVTGAPGIETIEMQVAIEQLEISALSRRKPTRLGDSICLKFWLHFGQVDVPAAQLGQVEVGGCFVLDQKHQNSALNGHLCNGIKRYAPLAQVIWNLNKGCVILDENYPAESAPDFAEHGRCSEAVLVPVFAFVELPSMSLKSLVDAVPGTILTSDLNVANLTIKLSANGTVFGEGQLVQIDDRVAVKITQLAK